MAQGEPDATHDGGDVRVVSVEPIYEEAEVFDLQIEEDTSFIVCGVVVHNSFQCASLDGQTFPVGQGPTPPVHFSCRSNRTPVIDGAELGNRPANAVRRQDLQGLEPAERKRRIRELVGQVPADTKFETFLSRQSKSWQDDYLGKGRAELWRKGDLTLKDLIDRQGQPWNLDELRRREGLG